MSNTQIFHDSESDLAHKAGWLTKRVVIYGILILWTVICLFPIYWTLTTSFKLGFKQRVCKACFVEKFS